MKEIERKFIAVVADYINDYGLEALLDELYPGVSPEEVIYDMYLYGMIPEDIMESFLSDDD